MAYEPAINTTEALVEKSLHHWLDKAVEAAQRTGNIGIIGFVVTQEPDGNTLFEPFSSSPSLEPKEFVDLVAMAARGMMTSEEPTN